MKVLKLNDETYYIDVDDGCLCLYDKDGSPKVWLSEAMCQWIGDNYVNELGLSKIKDINYWQKEARRFAEIAGGLLEDLSKLREAK